MGICEIIFANVWTWAGTVILVATVFGGLATTIKVFRRRTLRVTGIDGKIVEIENATDDDIARAMENVPACKTW